MPTPLGPRAARASAWKQPVSKAVLSGINYSALHGLTFLTPCKWFHLSVIMTKGLLEDEADAYGMD